MAGNERSRSRFQLYTVFSNLWHLRVKLTKRGEPFYNCRDLRMTLTDKSLMLKNEEQSQDFQAISAHWLSVIKSKNPGKELTFNFVLNSEVLKKKDKLDFDVSFDLYMMPQQSIVYYVRESRTISLQRLNQAKMIKFTSFLQDICCTAETEILKDKHVKSRNAELCTGETEFITKRKKVVFHNIRENFGLQTCLKDEEDVPNIAIIGSGGGMRAVIGMCGAMTALKYNGILDCTMFTSGVSGSAWYLMALYGNNKQHCPKEMTNIVRQNLNKFQYSRIFKIWLDWKVLKTTCQSVEIHENTFSVTDTFGEMIGSLLLEKDACNKKWSDQTDKLKDGSVPLPIVAALHVRSEKTINEYNEWVEFSPYEVFIPKYGAAIDMNNFGDEFYGGFSLRKHKGSSIAHLQGICGSGFAKVRELKPKVRELKPKVRELKPKEGKRYMFWSQVKDSIQLLFDTFDTTFVGKVPNWLRGIPGLNPLDDNQDTEIDKVDLEKEDMMFVDAGIAFNSPYPTVLRPSRKVDLILSFDFSRRKDTDWPFWHLEEAERWAKKRCVPFPKLNPQLLWIKKEWQKGNYKEVYVFPGDNSPTIIHFVTINESFRKTITTDGVEHDFDICPKYSISRFNYSTFRFNYSEQDFDKLSFLVQHNIKKNKAKIALAIKREITQKQHRRKEMEERERHL